MNCPKCDEELYELNPGVDNYFEEGDDSFIVREFECQNKECDLHGKKQDWFYDFGRVDIDGDEIELDEGSEKNTGANRK